MALSPTSSRGSSGGGSLAVTDGTHPVSSVTTLDFTAGVVVSDAGGGQANASVTGGAPTFTPTPTKTANYTTAAGEWVVGDSTGGAFTVTLPAAPANGSLVTVENIGSANAITVAAGAGDTINGTVNTSLGTTRRSALYEYRSSDKVWFAIAPATNPVLSLAVDGTTLVNTGTSTAPSLHTGTLDVLAAQQPPVAAVALNAQKITGLAVATAGTDAASLANTLDQFGAPAANVAFNAKKITGLAVATAGTDAASLANTLDQFGAPAANVAFNAKKITGLAVGTANTDSASLVQVTQFAAIGYVTAYYYTNFGNFSGTSSFSLIDQTLYAVPFVVRKAFTADRITVFQVSASSAGGTVRLGIYNDDGTGRPGTVLLDAGTYAASAGTSVAKEITISQALTPGLYWLCAVQQAAPGTPVGLLTGTNLGSAAGFPFGTGTAVDGAGAGWTQTGIGTGALPGTFTATPGHLANNAVLIWLRST